jgi:hypothetical protein
MTSLQTLDIKSNEVLLPPSRASSTPSSAGTSAPRRSRPTRTARRPALSSIRTQPSATTKQRRSRPATTPRRSDALSQATGGAALPANLQRPQGVPVPGRQPRAGVQGGDQRAHLLPEQPQRVCGIPASLHSPPTTAEGLRFSQVQRQVRLQLINPQLQQSSY